VMGLKEQLRFEGRRAILVDDGIATGMTAVAAADSLRKMGATELIISAPVIAAQTSISCSNIAIEWWPC